MSVRKAKELMKSWKDNVSFILVETGEPGNIGAAARALKNMVFRRLELVTPGEFLDGMGAQDDSRYMRTD